MQNGSDYQPATLSDLNFFLDWIGHIINILSTELEQSLWENFDPHLRLGQDSLAQNLKILIVLRNENEKLRMDVVL